MTLSDDMRCSAVYRRAAVLLLVVGWLGAHAQWQLGFKYVLAQGANSRIFLEYSGSVSQPRQFNGVISFIQAATNRPVAIRQIAIDVEKNSFFTFDFLLEPGRYLVDVLLIDGKDQTHFALRSSEPYTVYPTASINLSDLYLSLPAPGERHPLRPLLSASLGTEAEAIYLWAELASRTGTTGQARFVVYKEVNQGDNRLVSGFVSVHQRQYPFSTAPGQRFTQGDTLPLSALDPGEYLAVISLLVGGEVRLERSLRFEFGGDLRQRIFSNLPQSIRMMRYLLPQEKIRQLLAISEPAEQREAFFAAWAKLYRNESVEEMEAYYRRIFEADARYTDRRSGWETDRGRIFIQYGEPGQIRSLEQSGVAYERWTYPKWSLTFLFRKTGGEFVLSP